MQPLDPQKGQGIMGSFCSGMRVGHGPSKSLLPSRSATLEWGKCRNRSRKGRQCILVVTSRPAVAVGCEVHSVPFLSLSRRKTQLSDGGATSRTYARMWICRHKMQIVMGCALPPIFLLRNEGLVFLGAKSTVRNILYLFYLLASPQKMSARLYRVADSCYV